jgi:hypothetical protein
MPRVKSTNDRLKGVVDVLGDPSVAGIIGLAGDRDLHEARNVKSGSS